MKRKIADERGAVPIVEASIVFPVMFLVIFLLIYMGNAYAQQCRVEAIANRLALEGASYCVDPMLKEIAASNGSMPGEAPQVYPYRYLLTGEMKDTAEGISDDIREQVSSLDNGLFKGMSPSHVTVDAKFNNHFIASTFSVELNYRIQLPMKLLGAEDLFTVPVSSYVEVPVTDVPEFVRNVEMIEDYLEATGLMDNIEEFKSKIDELVDKASEFIN